MSSNLTNPEQVCPTCKSFDPGFRNRTDGSPLYGPLCTDSWHGKVAANVNTTDAQAKLNVNAAAKPDECPECKKLGWKCEEHDPFYGTAPAPVDQPDELDTIDTLTRDACSVGYCGPKSVYRKRLNAYIARRVLEELEALRPLVHPHDGNDMVTDILNERIAVIKKESQQ